MSAKQHQRVHAGPQRTQQITEEHLEFPFILISKSTMAFITDQS